jgi:hypothetical protein
MDCGDSFEKGLNLCKIGLARCETDRSKPILQSLQILILVDNEEPVQTWCLQEDDFTLRQGLPIFLQDLTYVDYVLLLLVSSDLRADGLDG